LAPRHPSRRPQWHARQRGFQRWKAQRQDERKWFPVTSAKLGTLHVRPPGSATPFHRLHVSRPRRSPAASLQTSRPAATLGRSSTPPAESPNLYFVAVSAA